MPSKSKAQKRLMAAVANNPKFAKKVGVPQSVGREFANADTRNKDMPSKYNSTANKPGKAVKKYRGGGRTAADHRANLPLGNVATRPGLGGRGDQRQLAQRAVAGAGALGMKKGGKVHDKKVLRNLDDEDYRIRNRTGGNTDAERRRINREKAYEKRHMAKGGKVQGYDARQDESLGTRNKTKGQQNLKSRRDEAAAMEKRGGKRKYSDVSTMDKGVVKKRRGGSLRTDADRRQGTGSRRVFPPPTPRAPTPTPTPTPTPRAPTPTPTPGRGHAGGGTVKGKGSAPKGWGIAIKGWR